MDAAGIFGANFMGGSGASFVPDLSGGAAAPSSAYNASDLRNTFDNSGWTVATGSAKAVATNAKNDPLAAVTQAVPWSMVLIAAVVAVVVWKLA